MSERQVPARMRLTI